VKRSIGDSGSSVTFFELLIFRINNLGENFRQIFGTKGLIGNIFRNNILAGGFGGVSPFEIMTSCPVLPQVWVGCAGLLVKEAI
jgi:hypothetical protein